MTIRMTESEYLARPADYRGVWTTERTDWPDWDEVRDQYMGKRTLMICEKGGVALVTEGHGLEIVPDAITAYYEDRAKSGLASLYRG